MEARTPAVAGMFYPGSEDELNRELDRLILPVDKKKKAIGIISPHAGYVYSGAVGGELVASVVVPERVVLIGPNHTGLGARGSVMPTGIWELPNGTVKIDSVLAGKLLDVSRILTADVSAHLNEHSLEVQLPFLAHEQPDLSIVPITLMRHDLDSCRELGHDLAKVIRSTAEDVLIVASSDMTHYESEESARKKDRKAIERVLALDPEGLFDTVVKNNISMCGVIPATVMLFAAKELGAKGASLVRYATSGEVSGDHDQVVGYAGILVE